MSDPETVSRDFLGLPPETTVYETARIVVLPVGFEATTSYGAGTRDGPDALLQASRHVETYDPDLDVDLAEAPIHTWPQLMPDFSAPEAMADRIQRVAGLLAKDGKWVLGLGGEHSVTLGLVRAAAEEAGQSLSVLQIDAHLDLREAYEGSPQSHASVMRRIVQEGHRTVHVGIRNACPEELQYAREKDLPILWGRRLHENDGWIGEVLDALQAPVYLSVDVDGFDPSVIRSTGTPEPGGLLWWPAMRLLEALFERHRVVGADIVELAPGDRASEFAAARLAARLCAHVLSA